MSKFPTVALTEVADFTRGLTYTKSDEVDFSSNIVLRANNVDLSSGTILYEDLKYLRDSLLIPSDKKVKSGSLIICTASGSKSHLGKVAMIPESIDMAFGGFMGMLSPRDGLDGRFLYYALRSPTYLDFISKVTDGANINNLKFSDLGLFEFPLPPLDEQKRIVAKLDEAMNLIRFLVLEISETNKLVSDFMSTNRDERLRPASNWIIKPLEDIAKFIDYRGRTPVKTESGVPLITAKNVKMGFLQDEPREYIDASEYEQWMSRGIPVSGDILITTEAPLGNIAQLETSERVAFAQRVIVLQVDRSQVAPDFVKQALLSKHLQIPIQSQATGATAMGIKASLLRKIPISFPSSLEEQQSISDAVSTSGKIVESRKLLDQTKQQEIATLRSKILAAAFAGQL